MRAYKVDYRLKRSGPKEDISAPIFPLCPRAQGERRPVVGGPQLRRGGGGEVEEAAKKQRLAVAAACAARAAAMHAATCSGVICCCFSCSRQAGACPPPGQRSHPFNRECSTQFRTTSFLPKSRSAFLQGQLLFCDALCMIFMILVSHENVKKCV